MEPRYDSETLKRVTALAQRLQARHRDSLSQREMETIGAEVGLEPEFIREAIRQLRKEEAPAPVPARPNAAHGGFIAAWWAAGWTLPMITVAMTDGLGAPDGLVAAVFFLGWAIYIGGGILVSSIFGPSAAGKRQQEAPLSRATLVDMLFALQSELEDQKQRRAFLSVDVAGSTEMKRGASELAVEYSFGRLRQHVEELVRAHGGTMQSAAGDGMMCVFDNDADAVGAARELQEGMDAFNTLHNRLSAPFRVRCGISGGDVAFDPAMPVGFIHSPVVDRAAKLQKEAQPGGVLVGQEVAAGALRELGSVEPVEPLPGEPGAFAWSPLSLPAPPLERPLPAELRQDRV